MLLAGCARTALAVPCARQTSNRRIRARASTAAAAPSSTLLREDPAPPAPVPDPCEAVCTPTWPPQRQTPALGLNRMTAEMYLQQLEAGWHLQYDDARRLRLRRSWVAPNGDAALALCQLISATAAALGLHPQLRLSGGQRVTVDLSTPALGLTELDLVLAARLDRLPKAALLRPAPLTA